MEFGLLLLRFVVGLTLAAHGAQKLFGWFGGYGIKGTGGWLSSLGFSHGNLFAIMAGLCELGGGLMVAAGFLTPVGAGLIISAMLVAVMTAHAGKGFFNTGGGSELPLILAGAALAIAFIGPGRMSLDSALDLQTWGAAAGPIALAIGAVGCAIALVSRAVWGKRDVPVA